MQIYIQNSLFAIMKLDMVAYETSTYLNLKKNMLGLEKLLKSATKMKRGFKHIFSQEKCYSL